MSLELAGRRWCCGSVLVAWLAVGGVARAVDLAVQIDEVMAGANGDSTVQFVEMRFLTSADAAWGPQAGETSGRVRLVFYDATGVQTGEFVFDLDAPVGTVDPVHGGYSVLAASSAFAQTSGMPAPDFILPTSLMTQDGKVCFTSNPANPNAPAINLCLSYGNFAGSTGTDTLGQPAGPPGSALPTTDAVSLQRFQNFNNYGVGQFNADFQAAAPQPRNAAGATGSITPISQAQQGQNLFFKERFNGNGRSCTTCHRFDREFAVPPSKIALLPQNDALFVAEFDPALSGLENPCMMHGARGLFLENIDGFGQPPVYRGSPHLLNVGSTAPYGLSGDIPDLQTFISGAVQQHLPRTLARNADPGAGPIDFRLPTSAERAAMEAYMQTIRLPADGDYDLDRMITAAVARGADAAAISRGRTRFFGPSKCFKCHSGPTLSDADATIGGGGNRKFNTGVVNLPINSFADACLEGQSLPPEAGGNREFSTPALIGVSRTAPYFHDNSVTTLRDAVAFYNSTTFNSSPAAALVGSISLTTQNTDDLTAFLQALVEPAATDCNDNGVDDVLDLNNGTSDDCNVNGLPDECELTENDCNGNLIPDECDMRQITYAAPTALALADGPYFITHADVDADGDQDLLVASWLGANVTVKLNDGLGGFSSGTSYAVASYPRSAAAGDVDGDGRVDLVVTNLLASHASVLLNNGSSGGAWQGFAGAVVADVGANGSLSVVLADFDGDGDLDAAVANNFTNQITVLLNNGRDAQQIWQGFAAPVSYDVGTGTGPWALAAGRMNADSAPDLVVACRETDNVAVLLNNGNGSFASAVNYAVQDAPEALTAADVTGDGKDDVVVANSDSDTVTVLRNSGDGTFTDAGTVTVGSYPFGAGPHSIATTDVDQDGDIDFVLANSVSNNVSVLLNNGTGGLGMLVNYVVPLGPEGVTAADFDGDGKPDIVTAHFGTDDGVFLRNLTPPFGGDCNGNGIPDACEVNSGQSRDRNANLVPDACEGLGDINRDGATDALDAATLAAVLLGADNDPVHVARADLNGDAARDGRDIQTLLAILLVP